MAYSEKDLFLVLTVVCLLAVIYLIVNVWRSAGKKQTPPTPQPKRIDRIHRAAPTAAAAALPKVPKPEPVKETPRLPHAVLLMNGQGSVIATARATETVFQLPINTRIPSVNEASLQVLRQYFKLDASNGIILQRLATNGELTARSMTVYDQTGAALIQSVPVEIDTQSWPLPSSIDLQTTLHAEVVGLYRREFLQRLAWQAQVFMLRLERCTVDELLQVPLHDAIKRPLTLLLLQRLIEMDDHWTRCQILNRIDGGLDEISFEIQKDGENLNQRIKLHLFALSQTKSVFLFISESQQNAVLSL